MMIAAPTIEVQGHRGARARFPENTLPAFEHALAVGADVLELDVLVSADDRLVVTHDPYVNSELCRLNGAPAPKVAIRAQTLAELRRYDCGSSKNPRFPRQTLVPGTKMPTLEEVFDLVLKSKHPGAAKVRLNIEAKSEPAHPELTPSPEKFAGLIHASLTQVGLSGRAVVQSFDHRILKAIKLLNPKQHIAMLISDDFPPLVPIALALKAEIISPHHEWITAEAVDELHAAQVRVIPWTANDPAAWTRLQKIGVDGIITDDPEALLKHLGR